jgi:hypothetical protein
MIISLTKDGISFFIGDICANLIKILDGNKGNLGMNERNQTKKRKSFIQAIHDKNTTNGICF